MIIGQSQEISYISEGSDQILYVYRGLEELWPGSALNNSNFLKYYPGNIKQNFRAWLGDPTAVWDQTLIYKSTQFGTSFLGPDTGIDIQVFTQDEFQRYDNYNIASQFNAYPATGLFDQPLFYDNTNMATEWLYHGDVSDPTAVWDQTHIYKGAQFGAGFLGPDTGIDIQVFTQDEFQRYDSSNIASQFNATPAVGIYDQDINYDYTNIISEWVYYGDVSDPGAPYDQTLIYKGAQFGAGFLGPDTGIDIQVFTQDEFQRYDSSNIASQFNADIDPGEYDQDLNYDYTNITAQWVYYGDMVDQAAPYDQTLIYKGTQFGTDFIGIDPGINPITTNYFDFQKYDSSNIKVNFTEPEDSGAFDFNLVYSFSNIAVNFID